jgi:cytochrome c oxidase assembly protein subunit 19
MRSLGGAKSAFVPTPPEKGSFPLDHKAECRPQMRDFLDCLKEHRNNHHSCKELSKRYLSCRIDRGLMAEENLDDLGFKHTVVVDEELERKEDETKKERVGFFGGISAVGLVPKEKR